MHIDIDVPDGQAGNWKVQTFDVTEEISNFSKLRAALNRDPLTAVEPGTYKRLTRDNTIVMTNTQMEVHTNQPIIRKAKGDVLINGLGLGMVLSAILPNEEVRTVRVIEKHQEVIELVAPTFENNPKVEIIHACAFEYQPGENDFYDAVWHDIWDDICLANLKEMQHLEQRYKRHAEWQGCWSSGMLARML